MALDFTMMQDVKLIAKNPSDEIEREFEQDYRELHESLVQVKGIQVSLLDSLLGNKPELQLIETQTERTEENLLATNKTLSEAASISNSTKVLTACAALGTLVGGPLGLIISSSVTGLIVGGLTGTVCGIGFGKGVNNWLT